MFNDDTAEDFWRGGTGAPRCSQARHEFEVVAYGHLRSFSCRSLLGLASPGNGGFDRPLARTVQKSMVVVFIDGHFTDFHPLGEGALSNKVSSLA
jgi:hypothetical protein